MSERFGGFAQAWLGKLEPGARAAFHHAPLAKRTGTHAGIADAYVSELGLKPIGFNWELLDAGGDMGSARSAAGQIAQALSHDISNPSRDWLPRASAEQCARDFTALFAPAATIVSNRYDGLWNPISGAGAEWAFVGFDDARIALLLIAER